MGLLVKTIEEIGQQMREGYKKYPPTIYEILILKILENTAAEIERQCEMGKKGCYSLMMLQDLLSGMSENEVLRRAEERRVNGKTN